MGINAERAAVDSPSMRDERMGNFIWLYFRAKWPALRIARANDIGEAKAREIIKAGVVWVDCALEVFHIAAWIEFLPAGQHFHSKALSGHTRMHNCLDVTTHLHSI